LRAEQQLTCDEAAEDASHPERRRPTHALAAFATLLVQRSGAWAEPASVGAYYSLGDDNAQSALYMDRNFVIPYRGQ